MQLCSLLISFLAKFRDVKFVKIRSAQAIENWPELNLPTLFVYHKGVLQQQMITLKAVGGLNVTPEGIQSHGIGLR